MTDEVDAEQLAAAAAAVGPLRVDDDVWQSIRPMQFRDAPRVASLHRAAMGRSLWARLGQPFLTRLYEALVDDDRFLGFVYDEAVDEGRRPRGPRRVRGFIAGSTDTAAMFEEVLRRRWLALGPAALPGIARDPGVLRQLVHTARYFDASAPGLAAAVPAESLFCSFEPRLRGRRVAGAINKALFDDLLARGHHFVKITTEVDNEGANRQLRSWGFVDAGRFRFYGKDMVVYLLDLRASPRVAPVSRHPRI